MTDRTVADIIADECIHDDADLATLRAMMHENERLRAELRRFQRIIIDASEATADCEDLCGVLCAGPCQGLDEIAAISQAAGLDELTGEPPIRRPYPLVGPHQGDPMTDHSEEIGMARSIEQSPWEAYEALIESIMENADHDFWDSGSDIEAVAYVRHLEGEVERLRRVCLRRAHRTWVDEFDEEADRG